MELESQTLPPAVAPAPCDDWWETVDGQIGFPTAGEVGGFGRKPATGCLSLIGKQN